MSDKIKKLANEIKEFQPQPKKGKTHRTLVMIEPEYTQLQQYCQSKGLTASDVINKLIKVFLEEIKEDREAS